MAVDQMKSQRVRTARAMLAVLPLPDCVMRRQSRTCCPSISHANDPLLTRWVGLWLLAGITLVLAWPSARGHSALLGWLPLWLVGMPLAAGWALLRFPLPRWPRRRWQARRIRGGRMKAATSAARSMLRPTT